MIQKINFFVIHAVLLAVILTVSIVSCKSDHDHDHNEHEEHDEHEAAKFQYTAYTEDFELFAEADPFISGKSSNILSHFTNLPSFTALDSGSITVRLKVSGKEINQTLNKPTRKGIYSFDIVPETAGSGSLLFDIKTEHGTFKISVSNITVFPDEHEAYHAAENEETEVSYTNTYIFTKEQSWKIDFATDFPKVEPFGQIIKTTGQIQSAQGDEILVSAKTNGIVKLSSENILEGKNVSNRQVLFSISGSGLSDNNSTVRFLEAKNNFEKTKSDYERLKELAKDKIVSEKDLLNAKIQYDNAKLIYYNLNKNFNSYGQSVISPMDGYVKHLFVQSGQYVEAGQAIVSISKNKTLLLQADVQQKFASILGTINSANIRTVHDNKTYTLEELNGKIISYGKHTNDENYLIPVSLQIDNKGNFLSGGFVELYLKTKANTNALSITNSAILEESGNFFVFVQITPELFEKRRVKLGAGDGLKAEILEGISQSERIVTEGAVLIKLSQATGTLDAHSGHVH